RIFFSIDKHEMEVIEVEGSYTKRNKIHRLPINVAQRYSVIVTANQPVDNYIMRSEFQKKCMPDDAKKLSIVKAIVHYDGAPEDSAPKDVPWKDFLEECIDLKHETLQPLCEENLPKATKEMELTIAFHNDSSGVHGHQFWVLGFGNGTHVDKKSLNTVNPIKRDTSTIPANGWTVFRFVPDNPGVFGIHCHMLLHLQSGLLMQLIEFPEKIKMMDPLQEWVDLCKLNTKY
ncbi:Cupredoxin, partial [Rhizophagus irregularis]